MPVHWICLRGTVTVRLSSCFYTVMAKMQAFTPARSATFCQTADKRPPGSGHEVGLVSKIHGFRQPVRRPSVNPDAEHLAATWRRHESACGRAPIAKNPASRDRSDQRERPSRMRDGRAHRRPDSPGPPFFGTPARCKCRHPNDARCGSTVALQPQTPHVRRWNRYTVVGN